MLCSERSSTRAWTTARGAASGDARSTNAFSHGEERCSGCNGCKARISSISSIATDIILTYLAKLLATFALAWHAAAVDPAVKHPPTALLALVKLAERHVELSLGDCSVYLGNRPG